MIDPRKIAIHNFTYALPDSRIATYPLASRDESKLLIFENGAIKQDVFRNLSSHLPGNSLMILNNTRVVEARIIFHKPTGAKIEVFCIEPGDIYPDVVTALSQQNSVEWKCLVGRSSSWKHQSTIEKVLPGNIVLSARVISKHEDYFTVQLSWTSEDLTFADILHLAGDTPLPPYIKRKAEQTDSERYQTVYAQQQGSVAAPTAGLHFTPEVFSDLDAASISYNYVTLHVSAGTFKPVKSDTMVGHDMHSEFFEVKLSLLQQLVEAIRSNHAIIAVGTTSMRTLESLYWLGTVVYESMDVSADDLNLQQWHPYDHDSPLSAYDALNALIEWMKHQMKSSLVSRTSLLIAPPYKFRVVDILITNFHQPRSTLLLLVAAFVGDDWKNIYDYALGNNFRFLSYGDSCLLFRQ